MRTLTSIKSIRLLAIVWIAFIIVSCNESSKTVWLDSDPLLSDWIVLKMDGAEGKLVNCDTAMTGEQSLRFEKTNGLGTLLMKISEQLHVEPGVQYELAVHQKLLKRKFASSLSFEVQEYDAAGNEIGPRKYSPWYAYVPNFMPGQGWERNFMRWKTEERASRISISIRIEGNPIEVVFDDLQLIKFPPSNDWPGETDTKEKPYDEAIALEHLRRRAAAPARVEMVNGYPALMIGDYVTTNIQHTSGGKARPGGFGKTGYHVQAVWADVSKAIVDKNITEFPELREEILKAVCANPDVWLIVQLSCDPPRAWQEKNMDHVWTAEDGQKWISWRGSPSRLGKELKEDESFEASYGSLVYRQDVGDALVRLGKYIAGSDAGKLVVGFLLFGGSDGQWYDNSQVFGSYNYNRSGEITSEMPVQLDHSPGHQQGFREWLRNRYHNDATALQQAWNDPLVSFDNASVSSEKDRVPEGLFVSVENMKVIESNHYAHVAPGESVTYFSEQLKKGMGRQVVTIRYHPDASEGYRLNTWDLSATFSGPGKVDIALEAQQYGPWRKLGSTGGCVSSWGSHHLMGSMILADLDNRSYRSPMEGFWDRYGLAAPMNVEGLRSQIWRDFGATASRGMGLSIYDIRAGTWDDPELWEIILEGRKIMEWVTSSEAPPAKGQMAVFVDPVAARKIHPDYHHLIHGIGAQRYTLNQSGVSYDMYVLDDILDPDLPDYPLYIFLGAFAIEKAHARAIEQKCRKPGKVVVFPANMGFGSLDFNDPEALAKRLTGMNCIRIPAGLPSACGPVQDGQGITDGMNGCFLNDGRTDGYSMSPQDEDAVVLGRYYSSGMASHAMKETGLGTAVLVTGFSYKGEYIPDPIAGSLPPVMIHNLARKAGIRTLATPGQVTYYGAGVAVCHRIQPGPAILEFESPMDLIALDGETILERGVTRWEPDGDLLGTDLVLYRHSVQ